MSPFGRCVSGFWPASTPASWTDGFAVRLRPPLSRMSSGT